jgi:hypothetical protein
MSTSTTTPAKDSTDGTVGTASAYSRSDHSHPINVNTDLPIDLGNGTTKGSASVGTSTNYARADHIHSSNI